MLIQKKESQKSGLTRTSLVLALSRAGLMKNQPGLGKAGFTLIEVLAAAVILMIAAAIAAQVLMHPKKQVKAMTFRSEMVSYLQNKMSDVRNEDPYLDTLEVICSSNDSGGCNADLCGVACDSFEADCVGEGKESEAVLSELVRKYPTVACYIVATVDRNCDRVRDPTRAKQVCIKAEWKEAGRTHYEVEAVNTFLFRP